MRATEVGVGYTGGSMRQRRVACTSPVKVCLLQARLKGALGPQPHPNFIEGFG